MRMYFAKCKIYANAIYLSERKKCGLSILCSFKFQCCKLDSIRRQSFFYSDPTEKKKEKEKSKCGGILHMVWTFCKLSQHSVPPVLLCQTVLCCRCHRFPSLRLRIRFVISSFRLPIFPLRLQRTPHFSCIHAIYILILFSICSSRALKRSNPYTC